MLLPHYSDNGIDLYEADAALLLPKLGLQADLVITSPPYDNLRDYGDQPDFDSIADAVVQAIQPAGVLVWIVADSVHKGSESGTSFRQALGFLERGLKLHDTMIYQKRGMGNPTPNRYYQVFEYMFVFCPTQPATFNPIEDRPNTTAGRHYRTRFGFGKKNRNTRPQPVATTTATASKRSNIWSYQAGGNHQGPTGHPAVFPLQLAQDHIITWTNPGDLVLDPMTGRGTTLRAAKNLDRRAIGIERNPTYVTIAADWLAQIAMPLQDHITDR